MRQVEIRTETKKDSSGTQDDVVKIVWQGTRIAKLVFASGKVIDFTRPDGGVARGA